MNQFAAQSTVNFNHRITGEETEEHEITNLTALGLSETIRNMTDRSKALLSLLLPYYDSESQREPDSRTMYFALNSIILELTDIQKTVEAYALVNKPTEQA